MRFNMVVILLFNPILYEIANDHLVMDIIKPSDLKSILHSKRANIYYLEHCRVLVNGGRVEYVTDEGKQSLYWNIPIANTTVVMLGIGTSVTQAAMRELARAGVMVGFCGSGGTPLYAGNETEVSWLSPQSEYRPTAWLQSWVSFWFDDEKRLAVAKDFQRIRIEQIRYHWLSSRMQREKILISIAPGLKRCCSLFRINLPPVIIRRKSC